MDFQKSHLPWILLVAVECLPSRFLGNVVSRPSLYKLEADRIGTTAPFNSSIVLCVSTETFRTQQGSNGYFNRFPWQRLGNHDHGVTTGSTRSRGNESVQDGRDSKPSIFRETFPWIRSAANLYKEGRLQHR
jgi:hypothetical protein